jgi:hypothetical protein
MNTPSLSSVAVLFAACLAASAHAGEPPKSEGGRSTAAPKPAPAPVRRTAEPPHATAPVPTPAPKTAEQPHAPAPVTAPAPAPKSAEPTHTTEPPHATAPAPAPKSAEPTHTTEPPHTSAPAPAPKSPEPTHTSAPAPTPKSPEPTHTVAPAPAPASSPVSTAANTWDNWQGARPVPTSFPAGVAFNRKTGDAASGDRQAYFVGRTDVTTTQGANHEQHTASGAIRLSADLAAQTISGQMGGFTSSTAATATALNYLSLTMAGTYDANGKITGTTSAQGHALGQVSGTLTTTLAQGGWTLAKNDFAINATFRAGRVNAPGH